MTKLEHFIFSPLFPSVNILFATASDESFIAPHSILYASWNTIYSAIFTRAYILFYLITVCYTVCYTGHLRHIYFSQQFTRVIIPNAPTVCDRLYTVHCLPAGTLYTWPFSTEPTFFLFDNCLLYCLLYWAISA